MMHLAARSSSLGDLSVDFCVVTMGMAKGSLLLSQHLCFAGCRMDAVCVKEALESFFEDYMRQQRSSESDSTTNLNICDAAQIILAEMDGIEA